MLCYSPTGCDEMIFLDLSSGEKCNEQAHPLFDFISVRQ